MTTPLPYLVRRREVLLAGLEGLPEDALHWRPHPDTLPISRSLQHVAAFELVLAATVAWPASQDGETLWPLVREGFGRGRPDGDWREHLQMLAAVRLRALAWLDSAAGLRPEGADPRPVLQSWGADAEEAERVALAMARDLAPGRGLPPDPVRTLIEHESYHRGQITLLKHLWSRRSAGDAEG